MDKFTEFEHAQWQTAVDPYHWAWGSLTRQTIPALLEVLEIDDHKDVLDIACGPGYFAGEASKTGAPVIGVDFAASMVTRARTLYPAVEFQEGDAQSLPFPNACFDAVGMNFGMLHLSQPEVAMSEALRVLRPGGRFAFTVWAHPERAMSFAIVLQAVKEYGQAVDVPLGPDFFRFSNTDTCVDALAEVGFDNAQTRLLELRWRLDSTSDVFRAFLDGTARIGALLRGQNRPARDRIESAVLESVARFQVPEGKVEIPVPAVLAWGVRP